jgi:hypothetical protein
VWNELLARPEAPAHALVARADIQIRKKNWSAARADIAALEKVEGQEAP